MVLLPSSWPNLRTHTHPINFHDSPNHNFLRGNEFQKNYRQNTLVFFKMWGTQLNWWSTQNKNKAKLGYGPIINKQTMNRDLYARRSLSSSSYYNTTFTTALRVWDLYNNSNSIGRSQRICRRKKKQKKNVKAFTLKTTASFQIKLSKLGFLLTYVLLQIFFTIKLTIQ